MVGKEPHVIPSLRLDFELQSLSESFPLSSFVEVKRYVAGRLTVEEIAVTAESGKQPFEGIGRIPV